ncbi:MAG: Uncharacterised protein [Formosa sp. Hel1_33_131]|jgi:hypothetical protein|nr:MAG: Uncharacterised protein [Formosa sp. Hel1_33_131]|tara:strand:+ start:828 stop:1004 length:177 start_codon:yes stop_codon:yes gene_type:complete
MGAVELRHKLIEKFSQFLQDDSKRLTLDVVFDSLNSMDTPSLVSEEHYKIVEERRRSR